MPKRDEVSLLGWLSGVRRGERRHITRWVPQSSCDRCSGGSLVG